MPASRMLAVIVLALSGFALQGCGLMCIPVLREYRGPVDGVMAVDAETGQPIQGATIRFLLDKYDNWSLFPPRQVKVTEHAGQWERLTERDPPDALKVHGWRDGDVMRFERKYLYGWIQLFFPIPLPLGWTLYHDHESRILVTCKGYRGLMLMYHPSLPPVTSERYNPSAIGNSKGAATLSKEGIMVFELERTTP